MIVSRDREKLINAIIYFLNNTKYCHTLKIFKLLNFSDFEHFRQTGRTITGLEYNALPKGPVPLKLLEEIKRNGDPDMREAIALYEVKDDITNELLLRIIKPKAKFNEKLFSKREMQILDRVAEFFKETKAEDMSLISHGIKKPWRKIYDNGKGNGKPIPSEMALDGDNIVHDAATIDKEELEYRRGALKDLV